MKREIRKILNSNSAILAQEEHTFESLYRLTFSRPERVMAEQVEGFRIRKYTYGEMRNRSEALAKGIYDALGSGRWVGLEMENGIDWIPAFWGILRSGNKPYLINTRHPKALAERILQTLKVEHILAKEQGKLSARYLLIADLQGEGECPASFADEIALASSGTSLKETICFYDGAAVAAQVGNAAGICKTNPRMVRDYKGQIKNLAFLPFYHVFGLFAVYFWFTCYHMTLVFLPDLGAETILKTCRRHEVTHIFAVPLLWHTIEKQVRKQAQKEGREQKLEKGIALGTKLQNLFPMKGADWAQGLMGSVTDRLFGRSVQFCISGGSALRPEALQLINGLGYPLHNGYGMTEIGIGSVELRKPAKGRNENSIGKPFDSVEYRINEEGLLEVRGRSLCTRRIYDGQELAGGDWFATGDLAAMDDGGNYFLQGRKGDLIIGEAGENINPDLLEQAFDPADAQAFSVLGLKGAQGEILAAVVQINPYLPAARIEALKEELRKSNQSLPTPVQAFYITTDPIMAETAIKVSRPWLRRGIEAGAIRLQDLAEFRSAAAAEFDRQSAMAQKVAAIIGRVLEKEPQAIEPDAHLMMDLGASSLQYFSILSALAEEFKLEASSGEDYCYTLRSFCDYIERHL